MFFMISFIILLYTGYVGGLTYMKYTDPRCTLPLDKLLLFCFTHPFPFVWNDKVILGLIIGLLLWIYISSYYIKETLKGNRMPGREYGQARFIDANEVNSQLADASQKKTGF